MTTALDSRTQERIARTHEYLAQQQPDKALVAARLAHGILDEILAHIRVGMRESEVRQFAEQRFADHGIVETWHPPYVRFGEHTLLTFMDRATEDRVLEANDVAFVDIGIVKDGIEGDAGRTIMFGEDAEYRRVAEASRHIFDEAVAFWRTHDPVGIALYEHIYALAEAHDVAWNLDPAGHLIGAYPHKGWRRGINHYPEPVASGKWILEIQVRHKTLPIGSFFEDVLCA